MRQGLVFAVACIAFAIGAAHAQEGLFQRDHGKVTPPMALDQPAAANAPLEGVAAGGLDFGVWRGTNLGAYAETMQAKLRARETGKSIAAVRADLEANGFGCEEAGERIGARAPTLECRLASEDRGCTVEWWAVQEAPGDAIKAGYDRMCPNRR